MIIHTYTSIWNEEKKLYSIYEWTLPTPISFKQLGLFALGAIIWMPLMYIFGVPLFANSFTFCLWFSVPVLLAIFGNKPLLDNKSIFQYMQSFVGFLLEPKYVMDGRPVSAKAEKMHLPNNPDKEHGTYDIEFKCWTRKDITESVK